MSNVDSSVRCGGMRRLARWLVRQYYPHIEVTNAERIPQTGPVLLCANHANALIDPVLIGITAIRPVRFMAKAPLFEISVLGPVMQAMGMVPAFRGSDDVRQVRRNIEGLNTGAKILVEGNAMGIFPEGKSTDASRLETIRSGAARMAVQAAEQGATGLKVVPIGITYEHKEKFRSSVLVRVAEPIDVDEWLKQREGDGRKAMRALTSELESRLRQVVVHLEEPQWEPWLDDLEVLVPPPKDGLQSPIRSLQQRKRIADAINHFLKTDRPRAELVADEIKAYRDSVRAAGLRIDSPVLSSRGLQTTFGLMRSFVWLWLLLVPAMLGTMHHLVPFVMVRTIASRLDQPGLQTVATHRIFVGVPIYLLWYASVAVWMIASRFQAWTIGAWLVAMPFVGVLALHYWRRARHAVQLLWHQLRVSVDHQRLKELRQQQTQLQQQLTEMAVEYK